MRLCPSSHCTAPSPRPGERLLPCRAAGPLPCSQLPLCGLQPRPFLSPCPTSHCQSPNRFYCVEKFIILTSALPTSLPALLPDHFRGGVQTKVRETHKSPPPPATPSQEKRKTAEFCFFLPQKDDSDYSSIYQRGLDPKRVLTQQEVPALPGTPCRQAMATQLQGA